ncbi:hypothetical protein IU448_16255 [Nocardia flavorosea]|uniref:hypothetical protein n=1 Tax=Nocardia flavorosea TaxID=53429 RepID=UPI001894DFB0|nr:hypothetical protein [Nocardia flavorosea]MBF6350554.1 hypothetical protein [Nocardia flavorosea]
MSTGDQPVGMDADALGVMGNSFRTSAGVIKGQATKIAGDIIEKAHVGAAYAKEGGDLESGFREIEKWLNDWAEATQLTGEAIGDNIVEFSTVDDENAGETDKAAS